MDPRFRRLAGLGSRGNGKNHVGASALRKRHLLDLWRNGYEALDALDDNGDGVLSGAELQGLALWRDANSNGVSDPGEVVPVRDAGLTELQCHPEEHSTGIPFHPAGATFRGRRSGPPMIGCQGMRVGVGADGVSGQWSWKSLVTRHWSLVIGHWSLVSRPRAVVVGRWRSLLKTEH